MSAPRPKLEGRIDEAGAGGRRRRSSATTATSGNAAPLYRTLNGDLHAFYRGTSSYLYDWWMDALTNAWHESVIAGPVAGTAAPINRVVNGEMHVFYIPPQ